MKKENEKPPVSRRKAWIVRVLLLAAVVLVWVFPTLWYTRADADMKPVWLTPMREIDGWRYFEEPVAESAGGTLAADVLFNGTYRDFSDGGAVRAFSAKRYTENARDIGLFVHTPDRCWTQGGWKLEVNEPTHVDVQAGGMKLGMERRVFRRGGYRELVYFTGLVGGQPLPYRLDHNYSVALKYQVENAAGADVTDGAGERAFDTLFWKRMWEAFLARRPLMGPKQFLRISTLVAGDDLESADQRLAEFLGIWLEPVDFEKEVEEWEGR